MQITSIVPAAYKEQAQLLLYVFFKTNNMTIERDTIFKTPVGIRDITHYIFTIELTDELFEKMMKDHNERSCAGCKWAFPNTTNDVKCLTGFFAHFKGTYDQLLKLTKLKLMKG